MKKHLFGATLMTALFLISGLANAQFTAIDDIQEYDANGAPASTYNGQAVTIAGNVFVIAGTYNGGSYYVQDATGGITFFDSGAGLNMGDYVEVSGTVGSYSGEIQLTSTTYANDAPGSEPAPVVLTTEQCLTDYENVGSFVSVIGTITDVTSSTFKIATVDSILTCYIDGDTGITLGAMAIGDLYQVKGPLVNYNGLREIKPRTQADLVENPTGDTVPVILNVDATVPGNVYGNFHWVAYATDAITVSADIIDDGTVVSADLYYRYNDGVIPGAWNMVGMSATGDNWAGTVTGPHTEEVMDFYISAIDDGDQTVTHPGDAPVSFRSMAIGVTSIYDMQYAHPDSVSQNAAYNGRMLNIQGIITAGPGDAGATSKFILQERDVNPETGTYAFGGVLVYEGSSNFTGMFYPGDEVLIGGECDEYNLLTEMIPHSTTAVNLVSYPNELPPASEVRTLILNDDFLLEIDGTGRLGEAWESVWVKTGPSVVLDTLGFASYGEYKITDKTGKVFQDSLLVAPLAELAYIPSVGDKITVEGFMNYYYGNYQIVPLSDAFIVPVSIITGVDDNVPTIDKAGGFKSIAPNPFNPSTEISFVLNKNSLVQLNLYNIRGEKVRTLIQDSLPAQEYTFTFDGKSDAGATLASGAYFARLRIGSEVMQVRKVMLLK